jgi:hypothetical protein
VRHLSLTTLLSLVPGAVLKTNLAGERRWCIVDDVDVDADRADVAASGAAGAGSGASSGSIGGAASGSSSDTPPVPPGGSSRNNGGEGSISGLSEVSHTVEATLDLERACANVLIVRERTADQCSSPGQSAASVVDDLRSALSACSKAASSAFVAQRPWSVGKWSRSIRAAAKVHAEASAVLGRCEISALRMVSFEWCTVLGLFSLHRMLLIEPDG